jgi:hypothetical protein
MAALLVVRNTVRVSRYIVQGGDWGAAIASWMAYKQPDALLGFHINMVNILAEDATPTTPRGEGLAL